jgi:hypothetical protein
VQGPWRPWRTSLAQLGVERFQQRIAGERTCRCAVASKRIDLAVLDEVARDRREQRRRALAQRARETDRRENSTLHPSRTAIIHRCAVHASTVRARTCKARAKVKRPV